MDCEPKVGYSNCNIPGTWYFQNPFPPHSLSSQQLCHLDGCAPSELAGSTPQASFFHPIQTEVVNEPLQGNPIDSGCSLEALTGTPPEAPLSVTEVADSSPAHLPCPETAISCGPVLPKAPPTRLASTPAYEEQALFYASSAGASSFCYLPPSQVQTCTPVYKSEQTQQVQPQHSRHSFVYLEGSSGVRTRIRPIYQHPCCSVVVGTLPPIQQCQLQQHQQPLQGGCCIGYDTASVQPACVLSSYPPMQQAHPVPMCQHMPCGANGICCGAGSLTVQLVCGHHQEPVLLQPCNGVLQLPHQQQHVQQEQQHLPQYLPPQQSVQPLQQQQLLQQDILLPQEQLMSAWPPQQPQQEPLLPQEQQLQLPQMHHSLQRNISDGSSDVSLCDIYIRDDGSSKGTFFTGSNSSICSYSNSCQLDMGSLSPTASSSRLGLAPGSASPIQQQTQVPPSLVDIYLQKRLQPIGGELLQQEEQCEQQQISEVCSSPIEELLQDTADTNETIHNKAVKTARSSSPVKPIVGIGGLLCLPSRTKGTAAQATVWHAGFRSPLGKEGRAEVIKRMRAVHRIHREFCTQTLADLGICFRRLAHATVEELWQLAYQWGIFEFALRVAKKSAHWVQHGRHKKCIKQQMEEAEESKWKTDDIKK